MQYFRTAQLYFKSLIEYFDISAISEHCFHEEQLNFFLSLAQIMLIIVLLRVPFLIPHYLSGQNAHGVLHYSGNMHLMIT